MGKHRTPEVTVREAWGLKLRDGTIQPWGYSQRDLTSPADVYSDFGRELVESEGGVAVLLSRTVTTKYPNGLPESLATNS